MQLSYHCNLITEVVCRLEFALHYPEHANHVVITPFLQVSLLQGHVDAAVMHLSPQQPHLVKSKLFSICEHSIHPPSSNHQALQCIYYLHEYTVHHLH